MARLIIVTAADANYGELAFELVSSIRATREGKTAALGLLDIGLNDDQRGRLRRAKVAVVAAGWDYDFSRYAVQPKSHMRALTARPHLPRYFPGYDIYMHIDADAWLQDWEAVELYAAGAEEYGFAITPEVDRSYSPFHGNIPDNQLKYATYRQYFSEDISARLAVLPQLNGGAFAGAAAARHWKAWDEIMGRLYAALGGNPGLDPQVLFYAEQACLNAAIWHMPERTGFLPAWCNWLCHRALPRCSEDGRTLFEPNPPYRKLGVVHMTGGTKNGEVELRDAKKTVHRRWLHYQGGKISAPRPVELPMRLAEPPRRP